MKKVIVAAFIILVVVLNGCNSKIKENNQDSNPENDSIKDTITSKDTLNPQEGILAKDNKSLAAVYKQLQKKPQSFSLPSSKDTTISCAEGTRIIIKANSFVDEKTKKPITGSVKILVTEYYKISDVILARLSTTTDGKMLETGGMLNITATSNNQSSVLKKGAAIGIEFPSKKRKEGMQLYNGNWKNENSINWTLDRSAIDLNKTYSYAQLDQMPTFPGGMSRFYQFISSNINVSDDCYKGGKVIVGFVIDKTGAITNAKIIRGIDKACDRDVLNVFGRLPKFSPGKMNGEPVNVYYTVPIKITADETIEESLTGGEKIDPRKLDEKYTDKTIQKASSYEITSYLFQSTRLGWINCDRPWLKESTNNVNYVVDIVTQNTSVNLIFHRYYSILAGSYKSYNYAFTLPDNEEITVVAIKQENNQILLAVKETTTGNKTLKDLAFKPVTFEVLKEELKKMDRFK